MTSELVKKKCVPCSGGIPPLKGKELEKLHRELEPRWKVIDGHHLVASFKFKNFKDALDYVNRVGRLAEEEQHHPDLFLAWGKVEIKLWTHAIGGLSESDFILAAKIDQL